VRPPPPERCCGHSVKGDQQDRPAHAIGRGVDGSNRSEDCLDLIREPIINAVFVIFSRHGKVRRVDCAEFRLDVQGLRPIDEAIRKGLNRGLSKVMRRLLAQTKMGIASNAPAPHKVKLSFTEASPYRI
jgi:hypothetical protein